MKDSNSAVFYKELRRKRYAFLSILNYYYQFFDLSQLFQAIINSSLSLSLYAEKKHTPHFFYLSYLLTIMGFFMNFG